MEKFIATIATLATLLSFALGQSSYCQISSAHTLCRFQGVGSSCNGGLRSSGLSEAGKTRALDLHNKLRSRVATGSESRGRVGGQPPAANMRELEWDDELAAIAQRWAEQCNFGHDDQRDVSRFSVGQNVYQTSRSREISAEEVVAVGIESWYDEVKQFDASGVKSYNFDFGTGHYTQMVWAETSKLGCGYVTYGSGGFTHQYLVCNYGRGGNFARRPIYETGSACSRCPTGTSCADRGGNPGLCRSGDNFQASPPDNFVPAPLPQNPVPPTTRRPFFPSSAPSPFFPPTNNNNGATTLPFFPPPSNNNNINSNNVPTSSVAFPISNEIDNTVEDQPRPIPPPRRPRPSFSFFNFGFPNRRPQGPPRRRPAIFNMFDNFMRPFMG